MIDLIRTVIIEHLYELGYTTCLVSMAQRTAICLDNGPGTPRKYLASLRFTPHSVGYFYYVQDSDFSKEQCNWLEYYQPDLIERITETTEWLKARRLQCQTHYGIKPASGN